MAYLLMHVKRRLAVSLFLAAALGGLSVSARAQLTSRYNNTATLLPDGNILVVGGQTDDTPTLVPAASAVILSDEQKGKYVAMNNAGFTVVSSHTATLLPNGEVLIAGGVTGALPANVTDKLQIYNPVQNCWRATAPAMTKKRYNHTATLLQNGNVLICGGVDETGATIGTCDLFTPTMPAAGGSSNLLDNCAAAGGSVGSAVNMLIPRSNHTATLLADGRVFITGGFEPSPGGVRSQTSYIVTSEIYTPGNTGTTSAAPLTVQRAFHRASLMGNGKVLIVGGYNGANLVENRGILDSAEIYDPIADRMSPAAPTLARIMSQGQVTYGDGKVVLYGGMGNITTTYINASGSLDTNVAESLTAGGAAPPTATMRSVITSGTVSVPLDTHLNVPVTGEISDGFILFSTPSITFPGGVAYLTPGAEDPLTGVLSGTYARLTNFPVGCNSGGCGAIKGGVDALISPGNPDGFFAAVPAPSATGKIATTDNSSPGTAFQTSRVDWQPHGLCTDVSCAAGTGTLCGQATGGCAVASTFSGLATITGLPLSFVGHKVAVSSWVVTSGNLDIKQGGSVIYSLALTNGLVTFQSANPSITLDATTGTGSVSDVIQIVNVAGSVTAATDVAQDPGAGGMSAGGAKLSGLSGTFSFAADGVDLTDPTVAFKVDVATVVIRKMVFSDETLYTPKTNSWSFYAQSQTGGPNVFGQTATLEPSASIRQFGGRNAEMARQSSDVSIIEQLADFTAVSGGLAMARTNQTSTVLPSGKILIAGGSNGPNVLPTAELFDPTTQTSRYTGSMHFARDLHSATLLPNGRVLVAGGFVTTATSSGPTNTAEIFYPNVETWVQTTNMPYNADNHTATLLPDGNVLVAGGFDNGTYLDKASIYVTTAAAWISLPAMPERRALHTASLLQDGRVLFTGGVNQTGVLCTTMIFDPAKLNTGNPWYAGPNIQDTTNDPSCTHIHSHAATSLKDGRVLLTGGTNGVSETDSAYIYTPVAAPGIGSFQNSAYLGNSLNVKRFGHTALTTPNGKVMIIGGAQALLGNALKEVETYDPAISSFQIVGQMTKSRFNQSSTLGADGYVYVFGGNNGLTVESTIDRNYFTGTPDADSNGASAGSRQPILKQLDHAPINQAVPTFQVGGSNLQGFGESAGGGAASGNSSHNNPRLILQAASPSGGSSSQGGGDFTLDLSTKIYFPTDQNNWTLAKTTFTLDLPSFSPAHYIDGGFTDPAPGGLLVPYGWYHLRDGVNAVYSDSLMVQVAPSLPVIVSTAVQTVAVNLSSITWAWSFGNTAGTADGWEVFSSSNGVFSTMTVLAQQTWTQFDLLPNTTAAIAVAAFNTGGDGTLAYSATYYTLCSSPTFNVPSVTTFSAVGFSSLQLGWDPDNNSPGTVYEVSQALDAGFTNGVSTPVPSISNLTSTTTVIQFLQPSTQYFFRVRAYNGNRIPGQFSAVVTTTTLAPVSGVTGAPPQGMTAYPPTTTIEWSWIDPGTVLHYNVYNATVPFGQPGSLIGQSLTNTFFDVNLATNTSRVILVTAVTAGGEGPLSPSATAYTEAATPGLVSPGIVNLSTGSFSAFWTANGNPLNTNYGMIVYDQNSVVIATVPTTSFNASFSFDQIASSAASAQFSVRVAAFNGLGVASPFLVLGTTFTLPDAPSGLQITGTTPQSISLSWSGGVNSSSGTYEVQYTTAVDFSNVGAIRKAVAFSDKSNKTSITVTGLQTSTTYQFRVQAENPSPVLSAFAVPSVTTSPFNGGVPLGSLGGAVIHTQPTTLQGSLGGGRTVTLYVPANAFPADTFVTISTFNAAGANSKCSGGVDIGLAITPNPYIQPLHPVFLTVGYTPAELGAVPTSQAALNRVDVSGTCVPLQTTLDTVNDRLTAQLNHFSQFQVAQVSPSATTDSAVVFPNPFYPSQGNGFVTFKSIPSSARVRIFTMRGELVFEGEANGSGLLTWGGTNRFGRPAASGVYLAVVESGGDKTVLKLVVLR